jgi:hypothetical protein
MAFQKPSFRKLMSNKGGYRAASYDYTCYDISPSRIAFGDKGGGNAGPAPGSGCTYLNCLCV